MLELCADYRENVRRTDAALRIRENFDIIKKTLILGKQEMTLYFIDGFADSDLMEKLMIYFLSLEGLGEPERQDDARSRAEYFANHHVPFVEAEVVSNPETMVQMLLSGTTLLLGETFGPYALIIDARGYPTRSVEEPQNDRVMLGPRDGFVETLIFNTALIRRRIRDTALTMRYVTVGKKSRTDVVICFMEGQADPRYVQYLDHRLRELEPNSLTMGHESLAELLIHRKWYNPFPKIRYTERPDAAAAQLLEGSVLVLCDNSPEVMILPTSIFDFLQETNDFYIPPLTGTYIRLLRHLVFWATLFLTPVWLLFVNHPELTPGWLAFCLPRQPGAVSVFAQLIAVELVIDGLRMASMNTPDMLSNSLSVVSGLILGDFAIGMGWLIPEVLVFMAFVAISNFTQRSYELGYAFKFLRMGLLVAVQLFGLIGFCAGVIGILILLVTNKTVNGRHSYFYPLIPFNGRALLSLFVRLKKSTPKKSAKTTEGAETEK